MRESDEEEKRWAAQEVKWSTSRMERLSSAMSRRRWSTSSVNQETREGRVESAERLADGYEWLGGGRLVKLKREERRMKPVRGGQEGLQTRVRKDSCSSGDQTDW